jgi:hypothetical protein
MIRRALSVAVGLFAVSFPVAAQQPNRPGTIEDRTIAFALNLDRPRVLSAADRSILFHQGPVHVWSDGGRLASENALANIGMASLDLFPAIYLGPNGFEATPARRASTASHSRSENFGTDGKDFPGEIINSPLNGVYYGGEIGFLYGQWTGKGGGDLIQSYILGTVGNDRFQITAGATYEESSGRTPRYRSFTVPR